MKTGEPFPQIPTVQGVPVVKLEEKELDEVRDRRVPSSSQMQHKAKILVAQYVASKLEKTDEARKTFGLEDVYVVWFCKTLQNWKALISTTLPDGMYYEVTYNGDAKETYIDAYKKFDNVCVKD